MIVDISLSVSIGVPSTGFSLVVETAIQNLAVPVCLSNKRAEWTKKAPALCSCTLGSPAQPLAEGLGGLGAAQDGEMRGRRP